MTSQRYTRFTLDAVFVGPVFVVLSIRPRADFHTAGLPAGAGAGQTVAAAAASSAA